MPGNGDIVIYAGTDKTNAIAEIKFNSVIAYEFDHEKEIMTTDGPMIIGANGSNCLAYKDLSIGNFYKLRDVNTDLVEVSVFNRFVFGGDVNPTSASDLMENYVPLYTFDHDHIRYDEGPVAITTSEFIEAANPMRKFVLAAFLSGICGSPGLP